MGSPITEGENPVRLSVWPLPRSLATTGGISVDVFSCPYLDVSVQGVPLIYLFDSVYDTQVLPVCVPTFGNLRITAYLQLPEAYRSLSRPSSAPDAKAFPLRSFTLNLFGPITCSRYCRIMQAPLLDQFTLSNKIVIYPNC